jgi:hypothetical protein
MHGTGHRRRHSKQNRYFVPALICFALSATIWFYGFRLTRERLTEHLKRSGREKPFHYSRDQ